MRSHHFVTANSPDLEGKVEANMRKVSYLNNTGKKNDKESRELEVGVQPVYGLRENPKKTWRVVDTKLPSPQENICKQCGKGFQSMKAVCGHMACHSEKERALKDDSSRTSENQNPVTDDSHSDNEAEDIKQQSGSTRKRYWRIVFKSSSISLANGSSSVSDIDEHEQEEVAMSLMMLSKDTTGSWGGVNSVVESSDNNSVVLETKSSSIDMRISRREGLIYVKNGDMIPEINKTVGTWLPKSSVLDTEIAESENSDSWYFLNGAKKVESDISVDGCPTNGECRKPKGIDGTKFQSGAYAESVKGSNRPKCYETEETKTLIKEKEHGDGGRVLKLKPKLRKREDVSHVLGNSIKKIENTCDTKEFKNAPKRKKYECLNCKRIFSSYQALGGHRPCHTKNRGCSVLKYDSGQGSDPPIDRPHSIKFGDYLSNKTPIAKESSNAEKRVRAKKSKGHECPICFRMFKSGQALGGHKRSHFMGGPEDKSDQPQVMKVDLPDLVDLNLPAPVEDEEDGEAQFMPW